MNTTVYHCPTKEKAEKLISELLSKGCHRDKWYNEYTSDTSWELFKENTAYHVDENNVICYDNINWYRSQGYDIVEY